MEYRPLGKTGINVGLISLGTEYLIDRPKKQVRDVIEKAVEAGINYFDLFWAKPEFRDMMGEIFKPIRDRVYLAAHLGSTHLDDQYKVVRERKTAADFFEDFLKRYHTDYVDVLFLHCCDTQEDYDTVMAPGGLKDLATEYKEQGKAQIIGFSGHSPETSIQAVKSGHVEVLMYPINPAGNAIAGRKELLSECAGRNIGVIAMKPFAAGKLLKPRETEAMEIVHTGAGVRDVEKEAFFTPIQGIHYALTQVGVSTILPGCENLHEIETDIAYFNATDEEKDFSSIIDSIGLYEKGECVYCNHCLPCPVNIDIGTVLKLHESAVRYGSEESARRAYSKLEVQADACTECGSCEKRCPFGVSTVEKIQNAARYFSNI